jgi:hypothetical protein
VGSQRWPSCYEKTRARTEPMYVHKRYDFDEETILRYALDLLRGGKI